MIFWRAVFILLVTGSSGWGSIVAANQAIDRYEADLILWQKSQTTASDQAKARLTKPGIKSVYQTVTRQLAGDLENPQALRVLSWLYREAGDELQAHPKTQSMVVKSIDRFHYKRPGAGELSLSMSERAGPAELKTIEKIATQNPSKVDQGFANLALAIALARLGDEVEILAKRLQYLKKAVELVPADTVVKGQKASDIIRDQVYVITHLTKGRAAPPLSGQTVAGRSLSLQDFPGQVKVLLFWDDQSVGSDSFLSVMRDTQTLAEASGAVVLGIYSGDPAPLRQWTAQRTVSWPNLIDHGSTLTRDYRIATTPTLFILGKENLIQGQYAPGSLANLTIRALSNEED